MTYSEMIDYYMRQEVQEELHILAFAFTHDMEAAKDLVQDISLTLYNNQSKIEEIKHPLAYLKVCLKNRAV